MQVCLTMLEILKEHRWVLDILDITLMSLILYRLLADCQGDKGGADDDWARHPAPCLTGVQVP